jgi:hypothetical protein
MHKEIPRKFDQNRSVRTHENAYVTSEMLAIGQVHPVTIAMTCGGGEIISPPLVNAPTIFRN